jgi:5-methylcytosine-specific restriction endonuclease McrA
MEYKAIFKEPELKPYIDFISEKQETPPLGDVPSHIHHIIPTCLGGEDVMQNIVILSVDDHAIAHDLLEECFSKTLYLEAHKKLKGIGKFIRSGTYSKWVSALHDC